MSFSRSRSGRVLYGREAMIEPVGFEGNVEVVEYQPVDVSIDRVGREMRKAVVSVTQSL